MKRIRALIFLLCLGATMHATAAVRASLDRDHIALGDSVTLTVESDGSAGKQPDFAPLRKDFDLRGLATGSQTTIVNGRMSTSMQWTVTLVPRHNGIIDIPPLAVGNERTPALRMGVDQAPSLGSAPASAQPTTHAGGSEPIFIETAIEPTNPYVQQAAIYTVRLYYGVTLLDAALDVPSPEHGDLRQVGDDGRTSVMLQGHRYDVLERHYLLQPEQSGALHIPAPVFQGRTMGDVNSLFDDAMMADGNGVRVAGKPLDVQVRPRPPLSRDPWLPAHALQLSVDQPSAPPRAGEPFSIVVKLSGDGVTAAQLPEIVLPTIPGAQVYPEPSSTAERAREGDMQAERTRRFAIVPDHAGDLQIPGLEVPWWDVVNDRAVIARLAFAALKVVPGAATQNDVGGSSANAGAASNASGTSQASNAGATQTRGWQIATLTLAALLVLSLWWGWRRGAGDAGSADHGDDADATVRRAPSRGPTLSRALALGDLSAITQALLDATPVTAQSPAPRSLGDVAQRLDDPAQRAAVLAFDAARWSAAGIPAEQALVQLRFAFAQPPRWAGRARGPGHVDVLPPLYPT